MHTVQSLAKQAALGAVLKAVTPAIKRSIPAAKNLFNKAKPVASSLIRPTVKPNPNLVAANVKQFNPVQKTVNYIANVPKGEAFSQRPIANTFRLLKLDGVPFVRRAGQASILGGLGAGAYGAYDFHQSNLHNIDEGVGAIGRAAGLEAAKQQALKQKAQDMLWKSYGRTLTAPIDKYFRGYDSYGTQASQTDRAAQDEIILGGLNDYVKRQLTKKPNVPIARRLVRNRTPVAAAINNIVNYVPRLIGQNMQYTDPTVYADNLAKIEENNPQVQQAKELARMLNGITQGNNYADSQ